MLTKRAPGRAGARRPRPTHLCSLRGRAGRIRGPYARLRPPPASASAAATASSSVCPSMSTMKIYSPGLPFHRTRLHGSEVHPVARKGTQQVVECARLIATNREDRARQVLAGRRGRFAADDKENAWCFRDDPRSRKRSAAGRRPLRSPRSRWTPRSRRHVRAGPPPRCSSSRRSLPRAGSSRASHDIEPAAGGGKQPSGRLRAGPYATSKCCEISSLISLQIVTSVSTSASKVRVIGPFDRILHRDHTEMGIPTFGQREHVSHVSLPERGRPAHRTGGSRPGG